MTGINSEVVLILGGLNSDILLYMNTETLFQCPCTVKCRYRY